MNILFLTTGAFRSINEKSMYPDLLREFKKNGHEVYIVSTNERRLGKETEYVEDDGAHLLRVKIGNLTKTNLFEKGISTLRLEGQFKSAIKRYLSDIKFDLILYSTPPITFVSAIDYVRKRDGAKTYLLLKDIFPQNAVDIGIMRKNGLKGVIYNYFRKREKHLYAISNRIGCMSQANVDYLIKHNPEINPNIVEVCPNCLEIIDKSVNSEERKQIRERYGIPLDKKVFIYGGSLGKPQGVSFIIECLEKCKDIEDIFILVVGSGTEYERLHKYAMDSKQTNFKLMNKIPKEDYDNMVGACDIGMIFLDHRFTIPNFPSRLLSYMQARLPVLAATDPNTDIGKVIEEGGFGWWCESDSVEDFKKLLFNIINLDDEKLKTMKSKEYKYLIDNYSSEKAYSTIMNHMK